MVNPISDQAVLERSHRQSPFHALYFILYYVGMRVIRYKNRTLRKFRKSILHGYWFLKLKVSDLIDFRHTPLGKRLQRVFIAPFQETADNLRRYKEYWADPEYAVLEYGQVTFKPPMTRLLPCFAPVGNFIWRGFHYLLPAAGAVALAFTMNYYSKMDYALKIEYNGEYVGYIKDEVDFENAEQQVLERMIASDASAPENFSPIYTFERIYPDQLTPPELLVNNLVQASGGEIQEATGIYVDGSFLGAVEDGDSLLLELKQRKDEDRARAEENAAVNFVQDLKLQKGLFPVSSLVTMDFLEQKFDSEVSGAVTYTVQEGDSPYSISTKFDVPIQVIYDLNPGTENALMVGDELTIAQPMPFLQKKVVKTITEQIEIPFGTKIEEDKNKNTDFKEVLVEGQPGITQIISEVTYIGGRETERTVMSERTIREPVQEKVLVGTLKAASYNFNTTSGVPAQSGKVDTSSNGGKNVGGYIWPVGTQRVICPIWGYSGHTGTDIGAPSGTPIWAAKDGTVTYSGWSRGYGYNVVIAHADGTKTRYAHCSALGVTQGQTVTQGETIASVGRTGNATCDHCHFEIISNGSFVDARSAIG